MQRIDTPTAAVAMPALAPQAAPGYFTGGNPATGVAATVLTADWCNTIQEELIAILTAAGVAPNKASLNQVVTAINTLISNAFIAPKIGGDAQFYLKMLNGNPYINVNANTYINYDRVANQFNVVVGGTTAATISAAGVVTLTRAAGDNSTAAATTAFVATAIANAVAGLPSFTYVNNLVASNEVPPGAVFWLAASSAPSGYLQANGSLVSRTTYANLFNAIGTTFGAGDGANTFGLPDLRGQFIRGLDNGRGVDTGRALGSLQLDAMQGHLHGPGGTLLGYGGDTSPNGGRGTNSGGSMSENATANTGSPVSDGTNGNPRTAAETRPTNVALLPCIKY